MNSCIHKYVQLCGGDGSEACVPGWGGWVEGVRAWVGVWGGGVRAWVGGWVGGVCAWVGGWVGGVRA